MQRIKVLGQGIAAGQLHHPFLGVIQPLANPEPIGGFQPRSPQDLAHLAGTTAAGVGEHRQSLVPLLQVRRQSIWFAAMQRQPLRVLPWPPQTGEGQLH